MKKLMLYALVFVVVLFVPSSLMASPDGSSDSSTSGERVDVSGGSESKAYSYPTLFKFIGKIEGLGSHVIKDVKIVSVDSMRGGRQNIFVKYEVLESPTVPEGSTANLFLLMNEDKTVKAWFYTTPNPGIKVFEGYLAPGRIYPDVLLLFEVVLGIVNDWKENKKAVKVVHLYPKVTKQSGVSTDI